MAPLAADVRALAYALAAIAASTALYVLVLDVENDAIVAVSFLLVVLLAAASARLWVAGALSVVAMFVFNFFFIPPLGTLIVDDPENWVALFAFLAVGLVGSSLSAAMRARAALADEHARVLEERKAADLARQREALKSALLASLAHDLKTPLTAIRVAAANLESDAIDEVERREQMDIVLAEVARLTQLFDNILDMARVEAGAIAAAAEWVPASEIVEAAQARAGRVLRDHPVRVVEASPNMVRVDPRLTSAALAHILANAARYSPAGSPIDIEIAADGGELRLGVRDHGAGVAPGDLPHLFERFYRGANARPTTGTGMGLSIARGLLAAVHGRISAENCAGGGARFTIVVPAEARAAAAEVP